MPTNKAGIAPTTAAVDAANATAVVGGAVLGLAGVGAKVWLLLFDAVADVAAAIVAGGAMGVHGPHCPQAPLQVKPQNTNPSKPSLKACPFFFHSIEMHA